MGTDDPFGDYPENPFAAGADGSVRSPQEIDLPEGTQRGKVGQVTVLGVLMAVHGALVLILGIALLVGAFVMPEMMKNNPAFKNNPALKNNPAFQQQPNMPPPEELMKMVAIGYGVVGGLLSVIGLMNLIAGIQVARFRSRTFGIISLSVGLLSVASCYCLPTSIGLFIYGLIVLMDGSVRLGFAFADRGHTSSEIQQAFARLPLSR